MKRILEMSQLNAEYLEEFIQASELNAQVIKIDVPTPTVETAARAVGTSPAKILKSLLFIIDGKPVLVIASGLQKVDRRTLAKHFNVGRKRVKLADANTVQAVTGYDVGGIPPIGHLTQLAAVIDEQVLELETVYGGGGGVDTLLKIDPKEIIACIKATPIDLRE
jgi:Cys-tRNA(Pro) deacylase